MASSFVLGDRFEKLIDSLIASGEYNNRSEVVRDALRQLERQRLTFADLDQMHKVGVESGTPIAGKQVVAGLHGIIERVRKTGQVESSSVAGVTRRKSAP